MNDKQVVFSGIQPTNLLHIGNYFGAIKNWVALSQESNYECFYCVVDLHAITIKQDPKILRQNILNAAKAYVACGINLEKSSIFVQSEIKEHTELAWILNTIAKVTELERMTQFKDKSKKNQNGVNMGLFDYPVLMAADILLYSTRFVPVGEDQKQHVELTRDLAIRFNNLFGQTFILPEPLIKKEGARIMGLDDPNKKMSKSADSPNNYISLFDSSEIVKKKISKAVTDSGTEVKLASDKPALANLLTIYSLFLGQDAKKIEQNFQGKSYSEFKKDLADVINGFLSEFQSNFSKIKEEEIREILADGKKKATDIAFKKMEEIKIKVGLG